MPRLLPVWGRGLCGCQAWGGRLALLGSVDVGSPERSRLHRGSVWLSVRAMVGVRAKVVKDVVADLRGGDAEHRHGLCRPGVSNVSLEFV